MRAQCDSCGVLTNLSFDYIKNHVWQQHCSVPGERLPVLSVSNTRKYCMFKNPRIKYIFHTSTTIYWCSSNHQRSVLGRYKLLSSVNLLKTIHNYMYMLSYLNMTRNCCDMH
jgi:hypothetical protein